MHLNPFLSFLVVWSGGCSVCLVRVYGTVKHISVCTTPPTATKRLYSGTNQASQGRVGEGGYRQQKGISYHEFHYDFMIYLPN